LNKIKPVFWALTLLFLTAVVAPAAGEPADAETQGRQLAQHLLNQHPEDSYTNLGVLHVKDGRGKRTDIPLRCELTVTATNWSMTYAAAIGTGEVLVITHAADQANQYSFQAQNGQIVHLTGDQALAPLAGSDFWLADLGQEFLHWPQQKLLKKEVKRSRGCRVLESTNPHPSPHGYARVVSWIDTENDGPVQIFAYDGDNQLLKEFYPKEIRKVNGLWQVGRLEISNDQTGSDTRLEFNPGPAGSPEK
jgi:hypothetical protein